MIEEENTQLQKFSELQSQLTIFLEPIQTLAVNNLETSAQASTGYREIKTWEKKIDARLKEVIAPLEQQIAQYRAFAAQVKQPLLDASERIKSEQLKYERQLESERRQKEEAEREARRIREAEAAARIKAEQEAAEAKAAAIREEAELNSMFLDDSEADVLKSEAEAAAAKAKADAAAEASRIAFMAKKEHIGAKKEIATHKVAGTRRVWKHEIVNEAEIPAEYKMTIVDEKKLKFAVVTQKIRSIPGVRIYEDVQLTTR